MTIEEKMNTITKMVVKNYNVLYKSEDRLTVEDVRGKSRIARKNKARIMTATIIRNLTDASLHNIGKYMKRNHSNIIHLTSIAHESFYFHDAVYKSVYEDVVSGYLGSIGEAEYVSYDIRAYAQKVFNLERQVKSMRDELMCMLNGTKKNDRITFRRKKLLEELNELESTI